MPSVSSVVLEAPADTFAAAAFGLPDHVRAGAAGAPGAGFRGFALSLVVGGPSTVDGLVRRALEHGATLVKPAKKSFWGYGCVVQAPDGTLWKLATSSKKDADPPSTEIESVVLLLGVDDVKASKRFYVERGLVVAKSFGGKYVQFEGSVAGMTLALLRRDALAKDLGVPADGTAPHGVVIRGSAGSFTDPDGFVWEAAA